LYRVCKKSDLDELIKNNFFKPICIIFTTKKTEKEFEDNIATLFKNLSKHNTYCLHLLINLDNFIDNINFFGEMRNNSPNFIAYFKGRQISSFANIQNNKELFLSSTKDIINKINSSYVQKLVVSFNQDETEKEVKNESKNEKTNKVVKNEEKNNEEDEKNNEEDEKNNEEDEKTNEEDEEDEENNEEDEGTNEEDEGTNEEDEENNKDDEAIKEENKNMLNNIKKRNIENISDKKEIDKSKIDLSKVDLSKIDINKIDINKIDLSKVDISKVDISKIDLSKIDLSKIDISKIDLDQLSIDKKKEKLKALLELKKQAQKN
jgi:uncharacterized protein YjbI with pentapeptide repeats